VSEDPLAIRAFLALPVPPDVITRLKALQTKLSKVLADVAWTRPESLHLTLRFFRQCCWRADRGIAENDPASLPGFSVVSDLRGDGGLLWRAGDLGRRQRRVAARARIG
jgi:hypothetical protein